MHMARFSNLADWLAWLELQHPKSIDLGLERVGLVADRLRLRELGCPVITVGGTNGKGSTVATLVSLGLAAGLRVGSYTSPHLLHFNERICLDGQPVADALIVQALEAVDGVREGVSLTYFEFTTLAAFWIFQQAGLGLAVLEVGLGGRLDAVNLVDADVAVVTSIGLDHTDWLGPDRDSIGREKAGIYRAQRPAICGDREPPASLLAVARDKGSRLLCKGQDYDFEAGDAAWTYRDTEGELRGLPLPGVALDNAATALAAWRAAGLPAEAAVLATGLAQAKLSGRLERVGQAPEILLDVAHNPHGAAFLMRQLPPAQPGQRTLAVFAMLADKDAGGVLDACLGRVDAWYLASLAVPRGANWANWPVQFLQPCPGHRVKTGLHKKVPAGCGQRDSDRYDRFHPHKSAFRDPFPGRRRVTP